MKLNNLLLFFLCTGITAGMVACSEKPSAPQTQLNFPELDTISVAPSKVTREIRFDGVVEAINQATVSAQTSGRVVELPVDVGDIVNKGDLIIRLTDTEQNARAESAKAKLNEAKAQFERLQGMLDRGLVARADFDKAESAFKSAEANLRAANEDLGYTRIYAPYAGIVVARMVKVGETVSAGAALMTGLSLESLRVQVDIPQEHIGPVRKFKTARIVLPSGAVLETDNIRIPPGADSQSHTFKVLVTLPPGDHKLYPGTLIKLAFTAGEVERLLVPSSAIAHRGEVTAAYILNQNKLELRMLKLGTKTLDDRFPVLAGLEQGEKLVIDPVSAAIAYKSGFNTAMKGE